MNNTKNFLEVARTTSTFPVVERLPISEKIQDGFISISADGILRFYSIFDSSTKEITTALLRQSDAVEAELANTDNEIYREELENLNQQLSNMVVNSSKSSSLREYGIQLRNTTELEQAVKEIIDADKRIIPGIVYLLGGPIEIKDKVTGEYHTVQKSSSKYNWIRVFTKERKDPVKGVVTLKDGTKLSVADYLDNYQGADGIVEPLVENETTEQTSLRNYLKSKAGL